MRSSKVRCLWGCKLCLPILHLDEWKNVDTTMSLCDGIYPACAGSAAAPGSNRRHPTPNPNPSSLIISHSAINMN